ncbi:MAG TPA: peptidoglycan glycosyltransferase FtsI, partial [Succinivibrio sp.]|nr:peptidoglycan glycosyltransferase FtsI [Succinivibrio sp.]
MTRIVIVWFFLIATTAVIVSRLLWIQVLHPEKLIAEGNMRVLRSYHYEPPRGLITDRNGRILAISIPVKTVIADPKRLAEEGFYNDPKNIEKVSAILEIKKDVLVKKIENRTKRYALLKNYLDPEKAKALKAISKKGFILEDTYLRRYPTGEANASLVGIINGDGVGVYGVEQSFNSYLTSTKTTNLARKDIYNHIFENIATVKQGTAGGNLILSIDNRLQNYAYQSLKKVVEENEADSGSAVLIDVISGEVLAMVNAPSFDPNNRKTFDSSNAKNRAVTDIFEPGSTMKPIVALSALEAKTTNWSEVFDTRPFIVDGKMVRDSHAMTQGTILDIIKYSSNTGMAHISMRTGPQKILSTLQDFGFGTKTQSGLVGESSGKLNEHRAFWSEIDKAT